MTVRITDISVSRHHSDINFIKDGTITLTDKDSKFGTLKLLNKPLMVPLHTSGTKIDQSVYL